MMLSIGVIVFSLVSRGLEDTARILVWVVILGVFFNAAITGSLAMVIDRLQARVCWLLVFAARGCGWDWWRNRSRGVR